jgi:hypothetical protein
MPALVQRLEAGPGPAKVRVETEVSEPEAPSISWEARITGIVTPVVLTNRLTPSNGLIEAAIVEAILDASKDPNAVAPAPAPTEPEASPSPTATSEG